MDVGELLRQGQTREVDPCAGRAPPSLHERGSPGFEFGEKLQSYRFFLTVVCPALARVVGLNETRTRLRSSEFRQDSLWQGRACPSCLTSAEWCVGHVSSSPSPPESAAVIAHAAGYLATKLANHFHDWHPTNGGLASRTSGPSRSGHCSRRDKRRQLLLKLPPDRKERPVHPCVVTLSGTVWQSGFSNTSVGAQRHKPPPVVLRGKFRATN
jgi:hypothetical protein